MELSGFLLFISSYCEAATFRQSNIGSAVCSVQFALLLVLSSTWRLMVTLHLLQKWKIDFFKPKRQRTIQNKNSSRIKNQVGKLQTKLLTKSLDIYIVVDMSRCKCYNIYDAAIRFLFEENFFHQMIPSSISDVTRLASNSGLINKGSPPRAVLSSKERVCNRIAATRRGGLLILISCWSWILIFWTPLQSQVFLSPRHGGDSVWSDESPTSDSPAAAAAA